METITDRQATLAVDGRHWHSLSGMLRGDWRAPDRAGALALAARIGEAADATGCDVAVHRRGRLVTVTTWSPEDGGLTQADVDLANTVTALAGRAGAEPVSPVPTGLVAIAIDALDIPAVRPFWKAVLGYVGEDDLYDPTGLGPLVWFQQMDAARPQRNRIHLDVQVAHEDALARLEAALAAGGHLVTDAYAPRWWVVADAEGNEACICTWRGRDGDDSDARADAPHVV